MLASNFKDHDESENNDPNRVSHKSVEEYSPKSKVLLERLLDAVVGAEDEVQPHGEVQR